MTAASDCLSATSAGAITPSQLPAGSWCSLPTSREASLRLSASSSDVDDHPAILTEWLKARGRAIAVHGQGEYLPCSGHGNEGGRCSLLGGLVQC